MSTPRSLCASYMEWRPAAIGHGAGGLRDVRGGQRSALDLPRLFVYERFDTPTNTAQRKDKIIYL